MMRPLIGTSWKMNLTSTEAEGWFRAFVPQADGRGGRDLFVLPSFPALWVARRALAGTGIAWGAQDLHPADRGAHTGDVSAEMLVDLGCSYVEVGHSERRTAHDETDALAAAKVRAALHWGLIPILCVGERAPWALGVARGGVARQLGAALGGLAASDLERVVVAYEPAWAIGEGAKAAPNTHIRALHEAIRQWLASHGAPCARVIYGGSINPGNAAEILAIPGVDGLFVGRAALDPDAFAAIARAGAAVNEAVVEAAAEPVHGATHRDQPAPLPGGARLAIGSDDAGHPLKAVIAALLDELGVPYVDVGVDSAEPRPTDDSVDYPDVAARVAYGIRDARFERGILVCGTGIGMAIAANKVPGVRAAQAHDVYSAERARKSNDAQVLALGARVIGPELARSIVRAWLASEFAGGGSTRKVDKIDRLEREARGAG